MTRAKPFFILTLGISLGFLISLGGAVIADKAMETLALRQESEDSLPFDELRTFTEIFGRIKKDYVEPVSDKKLLEDAIRGMLTGLDPHSTYLDQEQYNELKVGTTGQFGGLGIEVTMENGFVKVVSPIDDTPAQRAGIRAGDMIIRLDEKPVKGMTLTEAVKIMRGEPGSEITLTIVREGADAPLKFTLTRDVIRVQSVKSRMLEPGYGYVRVSSFQAKTGQALRDAVAQLKKQSKDDLKGIVLDLRNNPGGVLNAAVDVSDAFLESGLIVYTEGRLQDSEMKFSASPDDILDGAPIVVLINSGSASASEIVAGALQDHRRAVVIGEKSFGKGSVQTILPTSNGGAVKLTTARYYTPSGRSIQAEGIEPDIRLARYKLQSMEAPAFTPVKEADLSRHLQNGHGKDNKDKRNEDEKKSLEQIEREIDKDLDNENISDEDIDGVKDYHLHEALNLLKGISIMSMAR